jgi:phage FluMu protein Com
VANGNTIIFCRGCKQIIALVPFHGVPNEITCPRCRETYKVHWQKKWNGDVADLKYRMTAAHRRSKSGMLIQLFYNMRKNQC